MVFKRTTPITALDLDSSDLPEASASSKGVTYDSRLFVRGAGTKSYTKLIAGAAQQIKWFSLGDSVATLKMHWMYAPLSRAFGGGTPGAAIGAGQSGTGWAIPGISKNSTTGTVTDATADFDTWFSGLTERYATGATRTYGMGGVSAYWDTAKVCYVKGPSGPDGGTFKIQVDGVDEAGFTNVSASNGSITLGIATITKGSVAQRALSVVNLTGAHRIVGVAFINGGHAGLIHGGAFQGGISLANATSVGALSTLQTFLTDFAPDVISLECKEDSSWYATALAALLPVLVAGAPNATILGIGSTPISSGDADQVIQNAQLRAACAASGALYWDGYTPVVNYATLNALGWAGDGTHPDEKANAFLAGLLLNDLALLQHPGVTSHKDVDATNGRVHNRIDFGDYRSDGNALSNAALTTVGGSGFDISLLLRRVLNVVSSSGSVDASSWVMRPDNSADQQVPNGARVGSSGPYLQTYTDTIKVSSARGGGSSRDVEVRTLISGNGGWVKLPNVATGSRPTGMGAGATVFDTTLGKPIWYTGSAWVDATGASV